MAKLEASPITCCLCNSDNYSTKYTANLDLTVVQCNDCSLQYANPQPTKESLEKFYQPGLSRWIDEEAYRAMRRPYFDFYINLIRSYGTAPKTVMDIGCGAGIFLEEVKRALAVQTIGLDISDQDVITARQRVDHVFKTDIDVPISETRIPQTDVVTAFDVFEHLTNPHQAMRNLRELTSDEALLIIDTGDIGGIGPWLGRSRNPFVQDDGHIVFYSRRTMSRLLKDNGFQPLRFHDEREVHPKDSLSVSNLIKALKRKVTSQPNMIVVARKVME